MGNQACDGGFGGVCGGFGGVFGSGDCVVRLGLEIGNWRLEIQRIQGK